MAWWREGVIYQIYPRSFADANGDGIGDLRGITEKLDYLEWLGVDGIWLNPTYPSPNIDWGYDVADYTDVHPDLGTLADLDELIGEAERRRIRVLLDLVPNHTSDRHPWFRERPEFYVWQDRIPNNWRAGFGGGSAWTWDDERRAYYLHQFAEQQPDLDWWNPAVRAEFERILRFWFDRGVAGFRIDVAHALIHDRDLRDDIIDPKHRFGVRRVHSQNQPETPEILPSLLALADGYEPPRIFIGEAYVLELPRWATYYGTGSDELNLADGEVPAARLLDIGKPPRDPGRTPMPWTDGDGGWRDPWLPLADASRNVAAQRDNPDSTLAYTRELIRLRRAFVREPYERLPTRRGTWAWRRGDWTVAVNLSRRPVELPLEGQVALTTSGASFDGKLAPSTGVVLSGR